MRRRMMWRMCGTSVCVCVLLSYRMVVGGGDGGGGRVHERTLISFRLRNIAGKLWQTALTHSRMV